MVLHNIRVVDGDRQRSVNEPGHRHRLDDRVGSIARGKEADLLIVRGDPSTNIQDLSNVSHVFANGKLHDPQALLSAVTGQVGWR